MPDSAPSLDFSNTTIAYEAKSKHELIRAKLLYTLLGNPFFSNLGQGLMKLAVKWKLPVKPFIKATLYKQFIGGENLHDCSKLAENLQEYGVGVILDYALEGEDNEAAFQNILAEFKNNIDLAARHANIPVSVFKPSAIARNADLAELSRKAFSEWHENDHAAFDRIKSRFEDIFQHAYSRQVPVMVDAEESWYQSIIDYLVMAMMNRFNREQPIVINTYQLYRKDRLSFMKEQFAEAKERGLYFGAKLVRGAYLEKERNRATDMGYPSPVHEQKADTDQDYDEAVRFCISNAGGIFSVIATHNEASAGWAAQCMEEVEVANDHPSVWFSQLYGMADHISFNLAKNGYNVAKYIPYGPVKAVVPYLIRRAEENSSVQGQVQKELKAINTELKNR